MKSNYPKILAIALFFSLAFSVCVNAQSIVVSAGVGGSTLFDFNEDTQYRYSEYVGGTNHFLKFNLDAILPEAKFLGLSVKLEQRSYQADIRDHYVSFCGLDFAYSNRSRLNHKVTNRTLAIGLVPVNVSLGGDKKFRFGIEMAKSIGSTFIPLESSSTQERNFGGVNDDPIQYTQKYYFDAMLEFRLGSFDINENVSILPIVDLGIGISPETYTSAFTPRSIRSSLGFAFQHKLKSRAY